MIRWIITFLLLPAFSFFLTRGSSLFSSNFSSISISLNRRGEFFLWCLLAGGFFYSQLSLYRPGQAKLCLSLFVAAALLPYAPEPMPVCAILHTLLALAAALLFLYNLLSICLKLYCLPISSNPTSHGLSTASRTLLIPSHNALFRRYACIPYHSTELSADIFPARGRLCLLFLWTSCIFCLDSWILSGIINSAMEICLTLSAGILFWLFFPFQPVLARHRTLP